MIIDVDFISRKRLGAKCFDLFLDFAVIIIPFSTVEEDNNGEVHWNEKDLAV